MHVTVDSERSGLLGHSQRSGYISDARADLASTQAIKRQACHSFDAIGTRELKCVVHLRQI